MTHTEVNSSESKATSASCSSDSTTILVATEFHTPWAPSQAVIYPPSAHRVPGEIELFISGMCVGDNGNFVPHQTNLCIVLALLKQYQTFRSTVSSIHKQEHFAVQPRQTRSSRKLFLTLVVKFQIWTLYRSRPSALSSGGARIYIWGDPFLL